MTPFLWLGAALSLAPILTHWAVWRIRVPRRQTRAIVLILAGGDAALLLLLGSLHAWLFPALPGPGPAAYAHVALFLFAVLCAYVITYSALEADSPTLVMVTMLHQARPGGLPKEEFERRLDDELLLLPRLRDLVRDRMAEVVDGRYRLTPKGRLMASGFNLYASLLRVGLGG